MLSTRSGILKRSLLLFWTLWTGIVCLTNGIDVGKALGLLPHTWTAGSGNFGLLVKTTEVYGWPHWTDTVLLVGIIAWQVVATALFGRALRLWAAYHPNRLRAVTLAFTALLALFGAFLLGDEIFHQYGLEDAHRQVALLLLTSLGVIYVLPETTT